jgi:hypothetical protein
MVRYLKALVVALTFAAGYKAGSLMQENSCNKIISELKDKEIKRQNETTKTIIKSKKIAEDNHSLDRDQLINKL